MDMASTLFAVYIFLHNSLPQVPNCYVHHIDLKSTFKLVTLNLDSSSSDSNDLTNYQIGIHLDLM